MKRYSPPTRFDAAPFGTLCTVIGDDESQITYFIQLGHGEHAQWEPLGDFIAFVYKDKIHDPDFISECLKKYQDIVKTV